MADCAMPALRIPHDAYRSRLLRHILCCSSRPQWLGQLRGAPGYVHLQGLLKRQRQHGGGAPRWQRQPPHPRAPAALACTRRASMRLGMRVKDGEQGGGGGGAGQTEGVKGGRNPREDVWRKAPGVLFQRDSWAIQLQVSSALLASLLLCVWQTVKGRPLVMLHCRLEAFSRHPGVRHNASNAQVAHERYLTAVLSSRLIRGL